MNRRNPLSRRAFIAAGGAAAAATLLPRVGLAVSGSRPDSRFGGVQIGAITYSWRSMPGSAEELLGHITRCGISSVELMGDVAERFAAGEATGRGRKARFERAPMARFKALRKLYNDAGVDIHIVKFGNIGNGNMPDDQIEYYFQVARALGASGITRELSEDAAKRLGPMADRHRTWIAFHNHTQLKPETYDGPVLSYGKFLGINLDIGHYVAGTNHSPLALIEKHRDRIRSLHIKDRKVNNGPNMPFGQGDTPLALILRYMKRTGCTFPADIELEYKVPQGSDAVQEVTRCVAFCKQVLV